MIARNSNTVIGGEFVIRFRTSSIDGISVASGDAAPDRDGSVLVPGAGEPAREGPAEGLPGRRSFFFILRLLTSETVPPSVSDPALLRIFDDD